MDIYSKKLFFISRLEMEKNKEKNMSVKKGVPKRDGSGKGARNNQGRGGCATTRRTGRGRNKK